MTDLAGVSQTFLFNNNGAEADPNAPYTNSGAAATLTLDEISSAGVVTEASGAFTGVSVDVEGPGQFIFNGTNSIAGNVSILGGLLSVEDSGALGTSNAIVFNNGASFGALEALVDFATTQTIVVLNNSAATLEATNGATLTATSYFDVPSAAKLHIGSATDTGTVALGESGGSIAMGSSLSVDGGTLKILTGFSAALADMTGGVTVNGTLDLNGQSVTLYNLAGAGAIDNSSTTTATLTIDNSTYPTYTGSISGAVSLDDLGTGEVDLSGQIAVTQATIGNDAHLKIGADTNTTFSGNVVDNGTFEIYGAAGFSYGQQLSGSGDLLVNNSAVTLSGGNSGFTGTIELDNGTLTLANAAALGAPSLIEFEPGGVLETKVDMNFAGSVEFGGIGDTVLAATGTTLTLSGPLTDQGFFSGFPIVNLPSQIHIGSATDTGTVILGNNGGSGFSVAGASISIDGGTLKLANASAAALVTQATGGVMVTGTLDLDGQSVTLDNLTGAGTIKNSSATTATLTIDNSSASTFSGAISGPADLDDAGTGQATLTGHTSVTQATIGSGAFLEIGNGAANATFSGNIVDNGALEINVGGGLTYAQQLSGSGTFSLITPSGVLTLSGNNSGYSGSINADQGNLSLANAAALGAASELDLGDGTVEATVDQTYTGSLHLGGSATFGATSGHTLTFSGPLSDSGTTTVNSQNVPVTKGSQIHIGSVSDFGTVVLGNNGGAGFSVPGASISIDGGTLQLANATAAALVAQATGGVAVNGTLDLDGNSATVTTLTGFGDITNGSSTVATLTIDNSTDDTFGGFLFGHLNLVVEGSRVLILSGDLNVNQATVDSNSVLQIGDDTLNTICSTNLIDNGRIDIDVAVEFDYAQQLSGSGAFVVGVGKTVLSGNNSGFLGTFTFFGGTLSLANAAALGAPSELAFESGALEATVDEGSAAALVVAGSARLEASAGRTLTLSGKFSDSGILTSKRVGSHVYIGSSTDTGTVVVGNNGGTGFSYAGATVEIDGGTLNVQSNLSLAGVAVSFTGTAGKLILNSTAAAVAVSTAAGASGEVDLNSAQVGFTGGGETVKFVSGSNDAATLSGTGSTWDALYGSNGAVTLNGALASIVGGDDVITLQGSDSASLYNTAFHWDAVYGASETLYLTNAQASVVGGGDVLDLLGTATDSASLYNTGGAWDTVNGANGVVYLTNAQASILGGGDTVYLLGTATDSASLYNTNNAWDAINGSNGVVYLTNAQSSILGGGDTVYLLGTATDSASLYNTGSAWDTVNGSNGVVYLTNANASIVGGGDTAYLLGTATDSVSLYNTNNAWDTINGSHGGVILTKAQASVVGGGDTIIFDNSGTDYVSLYSTGGVADTVSAVNGHVILTSAQASVVGYGDTIYMTGASTANETLTNSALDDTYVYQQNMGVSTINGFTTHDAMQLSHADFANLQTLFNDMSQSGANTIIKLDANDQITLTNVQKSSLAASQFSLT